MQRASPLKAVIQLTEKRDMHALAKCLIEILGEFIAAKNIALYGIYNENGDKEFNETNIAGATIRDLSNPNQYSESLLREKEGFDSCIKTQKMVVLNNSKSHKRFIIPVYGIHNITELVVIDCKNINSEDQSQITQILRIYSNQKSLLTRNELDALTGLLNRQSFDDRMRKIAVGLSERQMQRRTDDRPKASCFAIMDIDHFKKVNDEYGHLYGDEVLLLFARLMTKSFRHYDLLFRYGGEEFAVVLNHTDLETALTILERFRITIENYNFPQIGTKTISIGVTEISNQTMLSNIIDRADKALYYAKKNGRNLVCCYEKLAAAGLISGDKTTAENIELF
jgi:diguanylate cyclase (GGDEF)-like protein